MKNLSMKEKMRMQNIMKVLALGTVAALAVGTAGAQTGTLQGRQIFLYDNGVGANLNRIVLQTPADVSLTANYGITLPATAGALNQLLVNQGSGVLDWSSTLTLSSLTVTGPFVANGNVTLGDAPADVITVNGTMGFPGLTAGLPLQLNGLGQLVGLAIDLNSGSSDISGTLSVPNGGTGATSFTANGVLYGNGTGAIGSTLAGTAGQVLVGTAGAPAWSATPSLSALTLTNTTNQLVLGAAPNTTTINSPAPGAPRTYTVPDAGANASFVMTEGAQTINGAKLIGGSLAPTGAGTITANQFASATSVTSLVDLGTAAGEVSGTLPVTNGGTGLNAVATGDILYGSAANTLSALGIGAANEYLGVTAGLPDWKPLSADVWVLGGNTSGVNGSNNILGINHAAGQPLRMYVQGSEAMRLNVDGTITMENTTAASATTVSIVGTTTQGTTNFFQIRNSAAQNMVNVHQVTGTSRLLIGQTALPGMMALSSGAHWIYTNVESDLAGSRNYTLPTTEADGQYVISNGDGTANQILQSNGNDLRASWTSTPSFSSLTLTNTTNQLVLGTAPNTTTINSPAPAAPRVYTVPDAGADASFVMTEGAQTINGTKTFGGAVNMSGLMPGGANLPLQLDGSGNIVAAAISLTSGSSDITGTLAVGNGGTGATSFTGNSVIVSNAGGTALTSLTPGASQILVSTAGSVPAFSSSLPSGVTIGFADVTAGTNENDALLVGNGSSLAPTGTGTITANALTGVASNGIIVQITPGTFTSRAITATAGGLTVNNGNGVSGNPEIDLDEDLDALAALSTTGFMVRTGAGTFFTRTITGTANEIDVTPAAGDGSAGNLTISLPTNITLTGKTATGGTFSGSALSGVTTKTGTTVNTANVPAAVAPTALGAALATFVNTWEKVEISNNGTGATAYVSLPAGTDGQVMYVRFRYAWTAGANAVIVRQPDNATNTAIAFAGGVAQTIVAHMIYSSNEARWVILSAVNNP